VMGAFGATAAKSMHIAFEESRWDLRFA
jgi:hypothetical protein